MFSENETESTILKDARMWASYEDEGAGGYDEWNAYLYGRNMK